jgi:hypothetical protein
VFSSLIHRRKILLMDGMLTQRKNEMVYLTTESNRSCIPAPTAIFMTNLIVLYPVQLSSRLNESTTDLAEKGS